MIRFVWKKLNEHAGDLFIIGAIGVAWLNWRQWQNDRTLRETSTPPAPELEQTPQVTVLVAAWNEADIIEQHIQSFLALRYPAKQLILCAGGNDGTLLTVIEYATLYDEIFVVEQEPGKGKQVALQKAFELAQGEIIYLTDADCLLNDDAFERTIAPIIKGEWAAVTGSSRPLNEQLDNPFVLYQWAADHYALQKSPQPSQGLLGRNCAIRTDVLSAVGGFDTPAPSGTDYTLARQLIAQDYHIYNEKHSFVETDYPDTLESYYFKRARWLRNIIDIGLKSGDYVEAVRGSISAGLGIIMLGSPLVSLFMGPIVLAGWAVMLSHALTSRLRYVFSLASRPKNMGQVILAGTVLLLVDFWTWATVPLQIFIPNWRDIWR